MDDQLQYKKFCNVIGSFNTSKSPYKHVMKDILLFIEQRHLAAEQCVGQIKQQISSKSGSINESQITVHSFFRECWDAMNGIGRLINCSLYEAYKEMGLYHPPSHSRQCTFYNVRRTLENVTGHRQHPVIEFIMQHTFENPDYEYQMLSFYYNLSVFVPIPITKNFMLPGYKELPSHLKELVKEQQINQKAVLEAIEGILSWLYDFGNGVCNILNDQ